MQLPACQIYNPDSTAAAAVGAPTALEWGYRFKLQGGSTSKIDLDPIGPNSVAGGVVIAPGLTTTFDTAVQNAMAGTGLSTGALVSASVSTIFAVYWCSAGDFSGGLGFSTTMPTLVNGILSLGAGAIPAKCRFLGWIRTGAAGALVDSLQNRQVVNYLNRQPTALEVVPGYVNSNATTTYSRNSGSWITQAATAANSQCTFIGNGTDCAWFDASWMLLTGDATTGVLGGIGLTTTTPLATCSMLNSGLTFLSASCAYTFLPAISTLHTPQMLCNTGGVAITFLADLVRAGAAADPPATFMHGWIMA